MAWPRFHPSTRGSSRSPTRRRGWFGLVGIRDAAGVLVLALSTWLAVAQESARPSAVPQAPVGDPAVALPADDVGDYPLITSPVYVELVNRPRRVPVDWQQRSGAVSMNEAWEKTGRGQWYVELQRDGARWVQSGLAHENLDAIRWGLKQLEWGFSRMQADGSFACDDAFHSASFLVESTAHSIRLIEASPHAAEFQARLDALKPALLRCALWMISPANFKACESQRIYTHRRFLVACGLMECARIYGRPELEVVARYFAEDGIRLQRPDGAFPEKGGHDSSYHAVSLIYLHRLLLVAGEDPRQAAWQRAADLGSQWLIGRIGNDGTIDTRGNTRTGAGQERNRDGHLKGINRPELAMALLSHDFARSSTNGEALARRVLAGKESQSQ